MTHDEILNMEAGREMDELVATKITGWGWMAHNGRRWLAPQVEVGDWGHSKPADMTEEPEDSWWLAHPNGHNEDIVVPMYSTDIAAAWDVVEKLRQMYPVVGLTNNSGKFWQFHIADAWRQVANSDDKDWFANSDTAPLAICRAALLAVMEE